MATFTTIQGAFKLALIALAQAAEDQLVGEKQGPARKAWVIATIKAWLTKAGVYGQKLFGLFSLDKFIDAALDGLVDWAASKVKAGLDNLEKL